MAHPRLVLALVVAVPMAAGFAAPDVKPPGDGPDASGQAGSVIWKAQSTDRATPDTFHGDLRNQPLAQAAGGRERSGDDAARREEQGAPDGVDRGAPPRRRDPLLKVQERARPSEVDDLFGQPERLLGGAAAPGPPNTLGDVGRREYVELTHNAEATALTVYEKSTGAVLAGPLALASLWPEGRGCGAAPGRARYDPLANRWVVVQAHSNRLCVHVARTEDPVAGGFYLYQFRTADSPGGLRLGVWGGAYLVSRPGHDGAVYALDRERMLAGEVATLLRFAAPDEAGLHLGALTPADLDGPIPSPAGARALFVRYHDDEAHSTEATDPERDFLELWELRGEPSHFERSTLRGPTLLPMTEFASARCAGTKGGCAAPPTLPLLQGALPGALDPRLQYRNLGTHEALAGSFLINVAGGDRAGIRWFELRRTPGGGWRLYQEGTYSPDEDRRGLASVAMDGTGNLALVYHVTGAEGSRGVRYVGRLEADPLGALPQGEFILAQDALPPRQPTSIRVDPTDDCTFWYTNDSAETASSVLSRFRFGRCAATDTAPQTPAETTNQAPGRGVDPTALSTTVFYVRADAGGNGTGTDWTNAFRALPPALVRGATYYVADGVYPHYDFDDTASGTTPITIKKAVAADHGTNVGWNASLGDGHAEFPSWYIKSSYWTIDGQVGTGEAGHGFRVRFTASTPSAAAVRLGNSLVSVFDVTIRHTEISFQPAQWQPGMDGIKGYGGRWTIQHAYVHDCGRDCVLPVGADDVLIEHSVLARNGRGQWERQWQPVEHAQMLAAHPFADRLTVRYSVIKDWRSTGGLILFGNNTDAAFYGNVFVQTGYYQSGHANGAISVLDPGVTATKVYNNTFVNLKYGARAMASGSHSGTKAYNNLFYNCVEVGLGGDHDYNTLLSSTLVWSYTQAPHEQVSPANDPFVDQQGQNYRLKGPTAAGLSLPAPFDRDPDGRPRGADGTGDRGAYELGSVPAPAPTLTLTASPSTLPSGSSATLSWSSTNTTSCTASGAWSGTKPTSGSQSTGALDSSRTFSLECRGAGGSITRSVTLTVTPPTQTLAVFVCTNSVASSFGSCAWPAQWTLQNPSSVSPSSKILHCPAGVVGRTDVSRCPGVAWTTKPQIPESGVVGVCFGAVAGGDVKACNISVGGGEGWETKAKVFDTGAPSPVLTLSANPSSVASGGSATLSWSSTNATSCTASGAWSGPKPTTGSQSTGALTNTSTFSLGCTGPGGTTSQSVTVSVGAPPPGALRFQRVVVDSSSPTDPWMKSVADLNGDGLPDLIVSGARGPVVWYEAPGWVRRVIAAPAQSESGSAVGDVDGDGDVDVVVGATWYENVGAGASWVPRPLPNSAAGTHDVAIADIDGDGRNDLVMRGERQSRLWVFLQVSKTTWREFTLEPGFGLNGLDVGDLNADGRCDLVVGGVWMENPGGNVAATVWPKHTFAGHWNAYAAVKVVDIDGDRRLDIVLSVSEGVGPLSWFKAPVDPRTGPWAESVIGTALDRVHGFVVADADQDGLLDVAASEFGGAGRLIVHLRRGAGWQATTLGADSLHNLRAADVDHDGDLDYFGAAAFGVKPVILYRNLTGAMARRVLVFSRTLGFRHASIPDGIAAIKKLGATNGFSVDATEDSSAFTANNLGRYRAIVFLNPSGNVLDAGQRDAFRQYVTNGGGFVGVHNAAAFVLTDWDWYTKLVGARYVSEIAAQPTRLRVVNGSHLSTTALPDPWLAVFESYNFDPNPKANGVKVLINLDEASVRGGTMGSDHPWSWHRSYDGGLMWYTTGGADRDEYQDPNFLKHLLGGIRYVGGL